MGTLPEGQRQAIELLKLQELSLKEAAAVSGRPSAHSRWRHTAPWRRCAGRSAANGNHED